jgi:hypothetical protein
LGKLLNISSFAFCKNNPNCGGTLIAFIITNLILYPMRKIRQSFEEVVSGEPQKEHYMVVWSVIGISAVSVGICITVVSTVFHLWK